MPHHSTFFMLGWIRDLAHGDCGLSFLSGCGQNCLTKDQDLTLANGLFVPPTGSFLCAHEKLVHTSDKPSMPTLRSKLSMADPLLPMLYDPAHVARCDPYNLPGLAHACWVTLRGLHLYCTGPVQPLTMVGESL